MNLPAPAISPGRKFVWLLRREFWEHRGSFLWAPAIAGIVVCALSLLGAVLGSLHLSGIEKTVTLQNDTHAAEVAQQLGFVGDGGLFTGVGVVALVLGFVVFFYCLGALYDDRRDRSILFWKSLPLPDWLTVASKLAWALLLAPLLALLIGLGTGLCLLLISALAMKLNGIAGAWQLLWNAHPLQVGLNALSIVPVYAAWSMPTVGWLMLCSAFARNKPFLWATLLPLAASTVLSWFGALPGVRIPHATLWYVLGYRPLLSLIPGSWYIDDHLKGQLMGRLYASAEQNQGPPDLIQLLDLHRGWQIFNGLDVWIGIGAGLLMMLLAIWLRRRRSDA